MRFDAIFDNQDSILCFESDVSFFVARPSDLVFLIMLCTLFLVNLIFVDLGYALIWIISLFDLKRN